MHQTYIGAPIRRREDFRLLTGQATFTDDIKLPQMLHAAILRSPHAHARLTAIDATRARRSLASSRFSPFSISPLWLNRFRSDYIHCLVWSSFCNIPWRGTESAMSESRCGFVAESRYLAEDGLDAMDVTYEPLPAVTDMRQSLQQQVIIHEEPGRTCPPATPWPLVISRRHLAVPVTAAKKC